MRDRRQRPKTPTEPVANRGREEASTPSPKVTNQPSLQRATNLGHRWGDFSIGLGPTSPAGEGGAIQRTPLYRVQGGSSRKMITIEKGTITAVNESDFIYINVDDALADTWRSKKNRGDADLLVMDVSADFINALKSSKFAETKGLPAAQPSQDKKWPGSYAIKGKKWAAFLKAEQSKGLSKVWDIDEYFEQFEDAPKDQILVFVYEPGEEEDGFEVNYGEYKEYFADSYEWISTAQAEKKGYLD